MQKVATAFAGGALLEVAIAGFAFPLLDEEKSARPVVSLANEIAVAEFLENEGRLLLLRFRHFEVFAPLFRLSALASFREGGRKLILAEVTSKQSSP